MKRKVLISIGVLVLLLDWFAFDDITTGNESSLTGEYLMIALSLPILMAVGRYIYAGRKKNYESNR